MRNARHKEPAGALGSSAGPVGLWEGIAEIYAHLSAPRRRHLHTLLILMLVGALAELASLGAVLPFLSQLALPGGIDQLPWAAALLESLGAATDRERLITAGLIFSGVAIFAGAIRLQLAWSTEDFVFRLGHELQVEIQRRILAQPYSFHIHRHSSTLLASLNRTEVLAFEIILPLIHATISGFIALCIIAALIYLTPLVAGLAAVIFLLIYLLAWSQTRGRLAANSAALSTAWDDRMKIVQESLGGIRDVILDNSQSLYLDTFERVSRRLSLARARTAFIAGAPRHLIETLGIILIAALAVAMSYRHGSLATALPILGVIALSAQRLLPLLQLVYRGWSTVSGHHSVIGQILELLRLPVAIEPPAVAPLPLRDRICLEQVRFRYPTRDSFTLDEVTMAIPRGRLVALTGETGSGKSTLVDLVMGLLEPTGGRVTIDGVPLTARNRRRWQLNIAHVPQSIFLADASIATNVAISTGQTTIDPGRLADALDKAQLRPFVEALPAGPDTLVGEAGVGLSGGQRQLLGIARAFYKQAPVLVLDEATSALDELTEARVIDALKDACQRGATIIMIAHRASTVARCDIVAQLQQGRIVQVVDYAGITRGTGRGHKAR